jgi:hypothetical protein
MNIIKNLQSKLEEANEIYSSYESIVKQDPNNFAYKLSLSSLKNHISELQEKIKHEKMLRNIEVVEFSLQGTLAKFGSLPLHILGDLSKNLSAAILLASQHIKQGGTTRGKIPKDIINTLDLRLAGISSGSTKVFITGSTSPDLFGNSLLENSLENTFKLLESETPEKLTESVSTMGIRGVNKIKGLLKTLDKSDLEAEMIWSSPSQKNYHWIGKKNVILQMANSLDSIKSTEPELFQITGKFVMGSLKGQFEIENKSGESYRGRFPSELVNDIETLHLGQIVEAKIEKNSIVNESTGQEKINYKLVSFDSLT